MQCQKKFVTLLPFDVIMSQNCKIAVLSCKVIVNDDIDKVTGLVTKVYHFANFFILHPVLERSTG